MIGNLSEYAFDLPRSWNDIAKLDPEAVSKYFEDQQGQCWVVGSSALSPPEMGLAQAHSLAGQVRSGFSDVGFRLAFSAPPLPSVDKLRALVEQQPYLAPLIP